MLNISRESERRGDTGCHSELKLWETEFEPKKRERRGTNPCEFPTLPHWQLAVAKLWRFGWLITSLLPPPRPPLNAFVVVINCLPPKLLLIRLFASSFISWAERGLVCVMLQRRGRLQGCMEPQERAAGGGCWGTEPPLAAQALRLLTTGGAS